ncbi:uncharacterized protein METZ01_LOCUS130412 [marine metagenome]|uniref:Uncharacterized protein n=1 Tax=marine metagenome TaxID=408172 RepID=A0A381YKG9_9ZZZZ
MERCVEIRPQTPPQNRASQESGMIEVMKAEISGLFLLDLLISIQRHRKHSFHQAGF